MIVQVVKEIDGSVKVVEETTACSERQPSRFRRVMRTVDAKQQGVPAEKKTACEDSQEAGFNVPSPNLRLANLIGPIIGLLKTFSSQVSRCMTKLDKLKDSVLIHNAGDLQGMQ